MHILHFFYGAFLEWCLEDMDRKIQLGGERSCLLLLIVLKSEKTSSPPSAQTIHLREFGLPHVSPLSLFASLVSRASCWEGKKRERRKLALGFFTLSVSPYFRRPHAFRVTSLFIFLISSMGLSLSYSAAFEAAHCSEQEFQSHLDFSLFLT